jgi:hypothetical protein
MRKATSDGNARHCPAAFGRLATLVGDVQASLPPETIDLISSPRAGRDRTLDREFLERRLGAYWPVPGAGASAAGGRGALGATLLGLGVVAALRRRRAER